MDNRIRKWKHLPKAVQEAFLELYKELDECKKELGLRAHKMEILWNYISEKDDEEIKRAFNHIEELEKLK